jgi:hypothetical protein
MADLRSRPTVKDIILPSVVVIKRIRDVTVQDVIVVVLLSGHI